MRLAKIIFVLIIGLGALLWCIGASQPVYTDPQAPERLSIQLQDHPREQRFREWYEGLHRYETSHKRLTDLGRGLLACGLGLILAAGVGALFQSFHGRSRAVCFAIEWVALWALKIPLSGWYYDVRQDRFDFPIWGDSVAIPVISETITWIVGCIVTGILAALLMIGHHFEDSFSIRRPTGIIRWLRVVLLSLWLGAMMLCIASGVWDGDEGMVISCLGAMPLLRALISAAPNRV